jgi:glycosyltransferase involved in cell wall biosynthesis
MVVSKAPVPAVNMPRWKLQTLVVGAKFKFLENLKDMNMAKLHSAEQPCDTGSLRIAVLIPCYNEEIAVAQVVADFRQALPQAAIHVFDNNSSDETVPRALAAGALVSNVPFRGKGNVIRRMFADIDADIYVMVDGDATYHAPSANALIDKLIREQLDMVVGTRQHEMKEAYRSGHEFGNKLLTGCVVSIFGGTFTDMLSGYRVFSRRYVKSFPALAHGFETETELTVHALELRMPYGEMVTPYGARLTGSTSKLSTYKDGVRILKTIVRLYATERPLMFYSFFSLLSILISIILATPLAITYAETGLVPRFPTAILSTGLFLVSATSFVAGLILEATTLSRREFKRLSYLAIPTTNSLARSDSNRNIR